MAFNQYRKIRVAPGTEITEKHINAVQENTETAIKQVLGKDNLDRLILKNITLLPGIVNKVSHTLGRTLTGWHIIQTHGSYNLVYDVQDTNKSPELLLYLMTPAKITVDLEVF